MSKRDDEEMLAEVMEKFGEPLKRALRDVYDAGFAAGFDRGREVGGRGGDAQA